MFTKSNNHPAKITGILLLGFFFLFSCGSSSSPAKSNTGGDGDATAQAGSCLIEASNICLNYASADTGNQENCESQGGTYNTSTCETADSLGTCSENSGDYIYFDDGINDACDFKAACVGAGNSWTDGPGQDTSDCSGDNGTPLPFNVTAVASSGNTAATVTFSEAPNQGQAENASNYKIVGGSNACTDSAVLTVSNASLSSNTVTLTTSVQSAISYKICVSNVTSAGDGTSLMTASDTFTGTPPAGFAVSGASATSATALEVTFSETPNQTEAETASNYCIELNDSGNCPGSSDLTVSGASLSGSTATLTTASQTAGGDYKVYASNITADSGGASLVSDVASFTGYDPAAAIAADIQAMLDATAGAVSLDVTDATVTYVSTAGDSGLDSTGYWIQSGDNGVAIFVADNTNSPSVGDTISFTATNITEAGNGINYVDNLSGYSVTGSNTITPRDINALNATELGGGVSSDYMGETVDLTATLASDEGFAGSGYTGFTFTSSGVASGDTSVLIRLPDAAVDSLGLIVGCELDLGGAIFSGYSTTTQISVWAAGDITVNSCPNPQVVSAGAVSSTEVSVVFDQPMDETSFSPVGTNFTISGDATPAVSGYSISGDKKTVTLTTASQNPGDNLTVTVTTSVTNLHGDSVDGANNTADFTGYGSGASVIITEVVNDGSADPEDFVELFVTSGGSMAGYQLKVWGTGSFSGATEYTFDSGFSPSTGDYIVLHAANGSYTGEDNEDISGSKTSSASSSGFDHSDNAFDVYTSTSSFTGTDVVIAITDAGGNVLDLVPITNNDGDASATMMGIYADVYNDTATYTWTGFSVLPADGSNDATIQGEAISHGDPGDNDSGAARSYDSGYADSNTNTEWCTATATMGTQNALCP